VAVAGDHSSQKYEFEELLSHFKRSSFIAYAVILIAVIFSGVIYLILGPEGAGRRFVAGSLGGWVGGNLYFIKCTTELLRLGFGGSGHTVWRSPATYFIFLAAGVVAGGGLLLLNRALRVYPAVQVVPLYESFLIIVGSISAAAFFGLAPLAAWQYSLYLIGLCFTLSGIPILTKVEAVALYAELDELEGKRNGEEKKKVLLIK